MSLCFTSFITDPVPRPAALDAIDAEDDLYRTSYAFDTARLRDSIRFSGLLHPVLLQESPGGRLRVAAGYRRYRVCRELGWKTVPAIFATAAEPEPLYRAVLLENLSHRPFNPVEIFLALDRLRAWVPEKELVRDWLPRLGLDPSPKLLVSLLGVRELAEEARQALAAGALNIGDIPLLLRWPVPEQAVVFRLFRDVKMGVNLRREVAANLYEIQKRDGTPPSAFLSGREVSCVTESADLSTPEKAQAVRGIVRRGRYPVLTGLESAFAARVKALRLPPCITVQHPPFFEGREYRCTFTFQNGKEFQSCVERIRDIRHEAVFPEEDLP